jgi:site-specific DNA-methyltransferase (adenine-specific)
MSYRVFNGDCLEIMKDLSANSIDCFICDLPYGCLTGGGGQEKRRRRFINGKDTGTEIIQKEGVIAGCSWDVKIDLEKFWEQVRRLAKNEHTPVIHFCNTRFGYDLIKSNEKWFRYDLVWEKTSAVGFLSANKQPLRSHENIYVFSKSGAYYERIDISGDFPGAKMSGNRTGHSPFGAGLERMNVQAGRRCVKSVITIPNKKMKNGHPTAKPQELYEWIIKRYCPTGGTILDPTAGSFTSCKTARGLGRNAIGIEKSKEFFDKFSKL